MSLEGEAVGVEVINVFELPEVSVEQGRRKILIVYSERQSRLVDVVKDGPLRVALDKKVSDVP